MGSKEEILANIKRNKGAQAELPVIPDFKNEGEDLVSNFEVSLKLNAGKFHLVASFEEINAFIKTHFKDLNSIVSLVEGIEGTVDISQFNKPHELKDIDLVVVQGKFGVAENAAIWLPESSLFFRALPFITQHLVILLSKNDIVQNMHLAYQKVNLEEEGYGVFIAGPSKTADIEQNLVIGAHGSRSLTVFVL